VNDATFHSATLENGLTLIGEHLPGARSVAVGYFVGTGARDEAAEVSGVSHFLEHMLFKGTDRRSVDDINREFDELGARYNAYTGEERTVYYAVVLPERLAQATDLLSDMMRPALRDADFAVERAAARIRRDNGDVAVLYRTNAQAGALENAFRRAGIRYRITEGAPRG